MWGKRGKSVADIIDETDQSHGPASATAEVLKTATRYIEIASALKSDVFFARP